MVAAIILEAGSVFGLLTVIERIHWSDPRCESKSRRSMWLCKCACGGTKQVPTSDLRNGHTSSCGCKTHRPAHNRTHGMRKSITYNSWCAMKSRCFNENDKFYHLYGGRGISICDRWLSFDLFLEDMGVRPSKDHTLDRIENQDDYCKENCQWALPIEQANNTSRNVWIEWNGVKRTLAQWSRELGFNYGKVQYRLSRGWPFHVAILNA